MISGLLRNIRSGKGDLKEVKEIKKNKQQNNKYVNQDYQRQQEQSQTRRPLGRFNKDFGIATLNVRSLYGPHKINELRNSMIKNNISLLLLQETKMIHYKDEAAIRDTRLSDGTRVIHSTAIAGAKGHGASGGLAILISPANASYITSTASITSLILYIKITQQVAEIIKLCTSTTSMRLELWQPTLQQPKSFTCLYNRLFLNTPNVI